MTLTDAQLRVRDGNRCARCGSVSDLHIHHRLLRSGGGGDEASNRVTLCAGCHRWAHTHPAWAVDTGWLVSRYASPATVKIQHWLWPGGPILLNDDGSITIWIDEARPLEE